MPGHQRWHWFSLPLALYFSVRQQKLCCFKPYSMISTNFEGYSCFLSVLDMAGRELIPIIAALIVLCFGFVSKTAFKTRRLQKSEQAAVWCIVAYGVTSKHWGKHRWWQLIWKEHKSIYTKKVAKTANREVEKFTYQSLFFPRHPGWDPANIAIWKEASHPACPNRCEKGSLYYNCWWIGEKLCWPATS